MAIEQVRGLAMAMELSQVKPFDSTITLAIRASTRDELKQLDRHGRGAHGRKHDGEELLLFEAVAQLFVALAVDALEEKELAAGAADVVGDHASDG